jgi:hypothetical protein
MNTYTVIFTVKSVMRVFKEVVQANDSEHARALIEQMCKDQGMQLDHITSVVQVS